MTTTDRTTAQPETIAPGVTFTPGPWAVIEPVALDYRAPLIYGADKVSLVAIAEGGGPRRAITAPEARANAFLIAAAPDLYAALQAIASYAEAQPPNAFAQIDRLARAALAKAEGR